MRKLILFLLLITAGALAQSPPPPAPHTVKLAFTDSNVGTTVYKAYRSNKTGLETLYATITAPATTWVDTAPLLGANFYVLTATVGGIESEASKPEVLAQVPVPPTVSATVQ